MYIHIYIYISCLDIHMHKQVLVASTLTVFGGALQNQQHVRYSAVVRQTCVFSGDNSQMKYLRPVRCLGVMERKQSQYALLQQGELKAVVSSTGFVHCAGRLASESLSFIFRKLDGKSHLRRRKDLGVCATACVAEIRGLHFFRGFCARSPSCRWAARVLICVGFILSGEAEVKDPKFQA